MGKNNNSKAPSSASRRGVIEINGKRYDAATGAPLSTHTTSAKPAVAPTAQKPSLQDVRPPAKHISHRAPKPAQTLMRHTVKKPAPTVKPHSKAHSQIDALTKRTAAEVIVNQSARSLDPQRLAKAKHIKQSQAISHFSAITSDIQAPVLQPPASTPVKPSQVRPPAPARHGPSTKPQTTAELLEHALHHAKSHEQAPPARARGSRRKRIAGVAGAAALVILLIGITVTQNLTTMRLQMASGRAGFDASLPKYQPAGYRLANLESNDNTVASTFRSNSDSRSYQVVQKRSDWNSAELRENFVIPRGENYQTSQAAGRTIFLYGDGNATWVNGGVWYVIQGHDSLSNRQLVELARSL